MNEHAHGPEDAHDETAIVPADAAHAEEEAQPLGKLTSELWRIAVLVVAVLVVFFIIAALPLGASIQIVNEAEANTAAVDTQQTFLLPLGIGEFQASQLTVFLGFVGFTLVSILLVAVIFWGLVVGLQKNVTATQDETYTDFIAETQQQPAIIRGLVWLINLPLRLIAALSRWLARVLRDGLPAFLGQR